MQRVGDMQPDIPIDATVGRMPVLMVPWHVAGELCGDGVIGFHRQHVGLAEFEVGRQIKAEGNEAGLVLPEMTAVQIDIRDLAHALELNEDLAALCGGGQREFLAIPGSAFP